MKNNGFLYPSPSYPIAIIYTGVPFVLFTGSHCSVIDVKVLFLNVGVPGVGGLDPSPVREEKLFTNVINLQLASQLLELFCNQRQPTKPVLSEAIK